MKFKKANKILSSCLRTVHKDEIKLSDDQIKLKNSCEESFYDFVKAGWEIATHEKYRDNWHVEALCDHLQALYNLEIRRLIINMPPRMGKSNILSVMYPIWCWIKDPKLRFLYNSYGESISGRDSLACRNFLESRWIKELWGSSLIIRKGEKQLHKFANSKGGFRIATTISGSNTGLGSDVLVIDDPNNIADILSVAVRTKTNRWFDIVMPTRVHDPNKARFIISQQRCHTQDLSGHILSKNISSWVHLRLPMEFEKHNRCITVPLKAYEGKRWHDPRKREGELLFPDLYDRRAVEELKKDFNSDSYVIAGQLQQRPAPEGGGVIQTSWFKEWKYKDFPEFEIVLQSWDTALTKGENSAYSACTTWGLFRENGILNIMFLSLFKDKLEYPDLRKMVLRLARDYNDTQFEYPTHGYNPVNTVVVESKASGYSLLQDLSRMNWPPQIALMPFNPSKDAQINGRSATNKTGRARLVTHLIEGGQVYLPLESPKLEYLTEEAEMFLNACELFPSDESNDVIDTMSQAFVVLTRGGMIYNKEDYQPPVSEPWNSQKPFW